MTSFEETEQSLLELQQLLLFTFQPRPDDVAPVDELVHHRRLEDGIDDQVKVAPVAQVRDVSLRSGREVVEDEDLHAALEEQLGEVGADEPGAARDESAAQRRPMVATPPGIMNPWQP